MIKGVGGVAALAFTVALFASCASMDRNECLNANWYAIGLEDGAQLKNVNTGALEYAPAVSRDALELFFTRIEGAAPAIYRAEHRSDKEPFGAPQRVSAITGFVEAPALSPDGRALYYHKLEDGRFVIYRVAR
jgi:Tol biopolymer transport system component